MNLPPLIPWQQVRERLLVVFPEGTPGRGYLVREATAKTIFSEYQFGAISRLDLRTGERRLLTPVTLDAGAESSYQLTWGWTTPLVLSQHDSTVLYAGSNRLVKFSRRGDDWERGSAR